MSQPVSPSGTSWTLRGGGYEATVVSVGGGLRTCTYDGRDLLHGYDETTQCHAAMGQLLIPWPNRIADGRYTFEGTEQQLALTEPARLNASHGLARWAQWQRLDDGTDEAVAVLTHRLHGQPGYPHQLDLTARYAVGSDGLHVIVSAVNVGTGNAPYGFGAHPYLTVGRRIDDCELTFTARERLDVDPERLLPRGLVDVAGTEVDFSTPRLVGATSVDGAFTGLGDRWTVRLSDPESGRAAELSSDTPWVQLYSAEALGRTGLAVEPMTCPPNAFASGTDLITLAPGDTVSTSFTITATG
jgi:aldose 1-epimerase